MRKFKAKEGFDEYDQDENNCPFGMVKDILENRIAHNSKNKELSNHPKESSSVKKIDTISKFKRMELKSPNSTNPPETRSFKYQHSEVEKYVKPNSKPNVGKEGNKQEMSKINQQEGEINCNDQVISKHLSDDEHIDDSYKSMRSDLDIPHVYNQIKKHNETPEVSFKDKGSFNDDSMREKKLLRKQRRIRNGYVYSSASAEVIRKLQQAYLH